jgi:hypothetical protein
VHSTPSRRAVTTRAYSRSRARAMVLLSSLATDGLTLARARLDAASTSRRILVGGAVESRLGIASGRFIVLRARGCGHRGGVFWTRADE